MAFRIQDLMTDVVPGTIRWASCPGGTTCAGGGYAAASNTGKGDKTPECRPVSCGTSGKPNPNPKPGGNPPESYAGLDLLRRQLERTLDGPRA